MRVFFFVLSSVALLWVAIALVVALGLSASIARQWPGYATLCVPEGQTRASSLPAPGVYAHLDLSTELECPWTECESDSMLSPVTHATLTLERDAYRATEEVSVTPGSRCTTFRIP